MSLTSLPTRTRGQGRYSEPLATEFAQHLIHQVNVPSTSARHGRVDRLLVAQFGRLGERVDPSASFVDAMRSRFADFDVTVRGR